MTTEQEVLKDLKKVTLEELDEAIKAVDKQEQEEAIEYFKKHIKYFEEQIKFIEATDCDYYDEELELYQNRVKQFNTVLSMLEEKDKQIEEYRGIGLRTHKQQVQIKKSLKGIINKQNKIIDLMANHIATNDSNLCQYLDMTTKCKYYAGENGKTCDECIKQYFENKAKEVE